MERAEFATRVEAASDIVVDRTVYLGRVTVRRARRRGRARPGASAGSSRKAPRTPGSTCSTCSRTPPTRRRRVTIDFLRPGGQAVITRRTRWPAQPRDGVGQQVDAAPGLDGRLGGRHDHLAGRRRRGACDVPDARRTRQFEAGHAASSRAVTRAALAPGGGRDGPLVRRVRSAGQSQRHAGDGGSAVPAAERRGLHVGSGPCRRLSRETVWVNLEDRSACASTSVSVLATARRWGHRRGARDVVATRRGGPWIEAHVATGSHRGRHGVGRWPTVTRPPARRPTCSWRTCRTWTGGARSRRASRVAGRRRRSTPLPPNSRTTFDVGADVPGALGRRFACSSRASALSGAHRGRTRPLLGRARRVLGEPAPTPARPGFVESADAVAQRVRSVRPSDRNRSATSAPAVLVFTSLSTCRILPSLPDVERPARGPRQQARRRRTPGPLRIRGSLRIG